VGERDNLIRKILYEVEQSVQSVHIVFDMYADCSGNNHVRMCVAIGTFAYIRTCYFSKGKFHTG
jgi:hypothetical protein